MAGGVSAHPHPDQRGADPHPLGTAGPGWHCATSHGEDGGIELWRLEACVYADICAYISVDTLWYCKVCIKAR